jgi:hypothetical protein
VSAAASSNPQAAPDRYLTGTIAPYTPAFATESAVTADMTLNAAVSPVSGFELARGGLSAFDDDVNANSGGQSYRPVFYSLLWPGIGEISMGYYVRGVALAGIEAAAWAGYINYRDQGLESRAAYESFADEHWTHAKWVADHPAVEGLPPSFHNFESIDSIGRTSWTGWPGYHTYAPKDEQKQNFYENIGKYDWFISGWADWNLATKPRDTDLRTTYRAMRKESNDQLDTADKFIYLSIATRVFSVLETYLLVRKKRSEEKAVETGSAESSFRFSARPTGMASGKVFVEYKFR